MRFCIIGAGNTGKAYAAYLSQLGHDIILYDRDQKRLEPIRQNGLNASGQVEGHFTPFVTHNLPDAIAGRDCLLLCTVASGHLPVAQALSGYLEKSQKILVTNGCWGAVEFDMALGKEAAAKGGSIAETGGQLLLCSSPDPSSIFVKTVKKSIQAACTRPSQTAAMLEQLSTAFPQLTPAGNVLETSLNNSNPIIHGPLALCNFTRMENGEAYALFGDGLTRHVAMLAEALDGERVEIMRACGVQPQTCLELLNASWPKPEASIYNVFHNNPSYTVTRGPKTLNHRYLTEDLPYGLVPLAKLARKYRVKTPCLDSLLFLFSTLMDTDYLESGPDILSADLETYRKA